jgi:chromosome segregation ATPase
VSKLDSALKEVEELSRRRENLAAKLLAAKGDGDQIEAKLRAVEQRAYGQDDDAAEHELEAIEREFARSLAKQRGIAAEHFETVTKLATAKEWLRTVQLEADTAEAQRLTVAIAQLRAKADVLSERRAAILTPRMDRGPEARDGAADRAAVQAAKASLDAFVNWGKKAN